MKDYITIILALLSTFSSFGQIVDIPDAGFKEFLVDSGVDTNNDGNIQVSEAEIMETMDIDGYSFDIFSIEGIKSFKNLVSLDIDNIKAETVDISEMTNLEALYNNSYDINFLVAFGCTSLTDFKGLYQGFEMIDLSECTSLKTLQGMVCSDTIKLKNCTSLERLTIDGCDLTDLDISGCLNLDYVDIYSFGIFSNLDWSEFTKLDSLILGGPFNQNIELIELVNLEYVSFESIDSLVIQNCPKLEEIHFDFINKLMDLEDLLSLTQINSSGLMSETLRIVNCPLLSNIDFANGVIHILTLNNCTSITELDLATNAFFLYYCDLSNMSSLTSIVFSESPEEIILDGCYNLETFNVQFFSTTINYDFSSCINLKEVNLGSINQLETLIIQNGTSELLTFEDPYSLSTICTDPEEFVETITYLGTFENLDVAVTTSCDFANGGKPFKLFGTSYLDINNDSCKTSDVTLPFSKYGISNDIIGERVFFSNTEGKYEYNVFEGQYVFGPELLHGDYIFTTFPENKNVAFPADGAIVNQNFCFIPNPAVVDIIEVHLIPLEPARPGFDTKYLITYTNTGNVTRGGDTKLTFQDQFMDFINSEPMVDVQEEGFLSWSFEDLVPYETGSLEFSMNLNSPMDTPPLNGEDIINFKAEVGPLGNQTLTVYWSYLNQEVVNSFDPNDKTCLNGNAFDQELLGDYLKYMIRFENTGTAEAVNIVVTDTLDDTKFDVRTLQVINASHDVETELDNNIIKFIFKDIYLPFEDETNDGYVTFKIKTLPDLVLGDDIRNKAEIFFDFNFPIITNTTSTVISDFTSIIEVQKNAIDLQVFPNPAFESILIQSETEMNRIELLDISGKLLKGVSFTKTKNTFSLTINQLSSGLYFIKVYSEKGNAIEKIIKR